jgi:hypothetical protein
VALLAAIALATAGLLAPATAWAATRYAAPAGTGAAPCAAADPCPLPAAVASAATGEEISLAGGRYELPAQLRLQAGQTMHGPGTGADGAALEFAPGSSGVQMVGSGVTVRDLTIEGTDGGVLLDAVPISGDDTVERVRVLARGDSYSGAMLVRSGSTVRDTVVWLEGINTALAVATTNDGVAPVDLVNVTAVGWEGLGMSGEGVLGSGELHVRAVNSVFRATEDGFRGIAIDDAGGEPVELTIDHSNSEEPYLWGSPVYIAGDGMQSEPPLFADPAGGDFRQLAASPTVDAGAGAPPAGLGATDVAGDPRVVGAAVDIGAHELQPPPEPPPVETPPPAGPVGAAPQASPPPPPAEPPLTTAPRRTRPSISIARLTPRRFPAPSGRRRGPASRLRIRLSAAATVTFAVERLLPPRRGHGQDCAGPRPSGHPCTRFARVAVLPRRALPAGDTMLPFAARVHGRPLPPGRYRLRLVAHGEGGQRSRFRLVAFWVTRAS